jgi:pantoate--beta-alanine ligase
MGALHAGHLALIEASKAENDVTIASIFVNPTQFNEKSDLNNYPRTPETDCEGLEQNGCDIVFIPTVEDIYPDGLAEVRSDYGLLTNSLEAASRPGHFDGVIQVVRRLLEIMTCQNAYFGEKDFQQLAVVRHLVKSEGIATVIQSVQTVREPSGLALSSRNQLLEPELSAAALALSQALQECANLSTTSDLKELKQKAVQMIKDAGAKPEYFEIINPDTFEVIHSLENTKEARVVTAAFIGEVRLLDNMAVSVTETNRISEPLPH